MARWRDVLLQIDVDLQAVAPADARILQTLDPITLLLTACVERLPDRFELPGWVPARIMELEFEGRGPNTLAELAHAARPAAALSGSSDGSGSRREREVLEPLGIVDDLRVVFGDAGEIWGAAMLYRFDRPFAATEVRAVAAVAAGCGRRLRLAILQDAVDDSAAVAGPPGLARIAAGRFVEVSAAAHHWLATLADEQRVAAVTTLTASGARSVTFVGSCGAVTLHVLERADNTVIVERAGPTATGAVLMAAYDLTPREREVVGLVAHGLTATQMARRLGISEWTVKDHIKAVHRKVEVGTRTELLAALFARHFAPHLGAGDLPGPSGHFLARG